MFFTIFAAPLVVAAVSFAACYWRPLLAVVAIPVNALLAWGLWRDLHEPSIYTSIQVDLGGRAVEAHALIALILVASPTLGAVLNKWRRRRPGTQ